MLSERSWPLAKYSDLNANGRVYTNNISLHIQLQKRLMVVCHCMKSLVEVQLWSPNLIIKSRDSSVLVHLQHHRNEKKFRFRLPNLGQLKEVTNILSQFVKIADMNQTSQDIFSQLSNNSQISQDSCFSQSTFSQSSNSQSESSVNDMKGSPFYDESSSPCYSTNLLSESGMHSEFYDYPFNTGTHRLYHQSSISDAASLRENSAALLLDNVRDPASSNPYTSPFIRSVNTPTQYVDKANTAVKSTPRKNSPYLKDRCVQTDSETYDRYSADDFVQVITALNEDASFGILIDRIKEAIMKIQAPRPTNSDSTIVKPCSTMSISTPNIIMQTASQPKMTRGNGGKEDFSTAFGRVKRLLNDF